MKLEDFVDEIGFTLSMGVLAIFLPIWLPLVVLGLIMRGILRCIEILIGEKSHGND